MKPIELSIICLALVLAADPGIASHGQVAGGEWYQDVPVTNAMPVVQTVRVPIEEQICWDEQVWHRSGPPRSATPGIIGAIVGGVIGNQFGGGSGKDALTVAGAALGASVAVSEQRRRNPDRFHATTEQRCEIQTRWVEEQRVVAWDVSYLYSGQELQTRTRSEPGETIQIRVSVDPIAN